jgi:hypothetical protein
MVVYAVAEAAEHADQARSKAGVSSLFLVVPTAVWRIFLVCARLLLLLSFIGNLLRRTVVVRSGNGQQSGSLS